MEQLTKNQAVATSQEAVQNQNEPQLRDENAHNDKSVHRSEERFSRNAETDLVCRLLLEKKIRRPGSRVWRNYPVDRGHLVPGAPPRPVPPKPAQHRLRVQPSLS